MKYHVRGNILLSQWFVCVLTITVILQIWRVKKCLSAFMLLQSKRVIYDSLGFVLGIFRVCLCDSSVKHFLFPLFFFFFFCTFLGFPSSVSVYACVCLPLSVCLCVCPFPPSSPFIYQPVFFSASIVAVIFHARMGMFPWKFRWIQQQKEWKKEEKKKKERHGHDNIFRRKKNCKWVVSI